MSLLRPSSLDGVANVSNVENANIDNNNVQVSVPQNLKETINGMIESALGQLLQNYNLVPIAQAQPATTNNVILDEENGVDQVIEERFRENISEIDRIPDVVRCLRDFSGNPCEFSSWRKSVERVLGIYESIRGTTRYFGILSVIRNKIIGEADTILESYNTPLNWNAICKCLTLHYADKRDVSTLEFELMSLVQGNDSVEGFYKNVYNHLSLILNKVACMDVNHTTIVLLTKTYRDKALETFVRGLNGDLPKLLTVREPTDLPQALKLCQKLNNQDCLNAQLQNVPFKNKQQLKLADINPRRSQQPQYQTQRHYSNTQFYPQLAHMPQNIASNSQRQYRPNYQQPNLPPPRPTAPKPSVPMEIDSSIQTRRVDYMNRPRNNSVQNSRQWVHPSYLNKQTNFNISNQLQQEIPDDAFQQDEMAECYESEQCDFTDINFLD